MDDIEVWGLGCRAGTKWNLDEVDEDYDYVILILTSRIGYADMQVTWSQAIWGRGLKP